MRHRWGILAILLFIRLAMPLQFQSVGAMAPLLGSNFGISLADIGLVIGFSHAARGAGAWWQQTWQQFGDKQTALAGLMLTLIGELVTNYQLPTPHNIIYLDPLEPEYRELSGAARAREEG